MEKPFLADKFQIAWSELKPENIVSDITEAIEIAQNQVDLISQPSSAGDELTFEVENAEKGPAAVNLQKTS